MSQLPTNDPRRSLPALDRLLADPRLASLERVYGREPLVVQARLALAEQRLALAADARAEGDGALIAALAARIAERLAAELPPPLRRTLNATGIFLHTNLGRAPLPRDVAAALPDLLTAACDLEIDLASGRRGDRLARIAALLERITGAPAALAVNNNAAALLLVLGALARGREVVVSRGELVEIGDSFRIPDLVAAAGATLVEVGTTNRTHAADYERALSPRTALLLKVHPSNYRVEGFVASVDTAALAEIARGAGVPLLVDEGAGLLRASRAPELAGHASFEELLAAGADLVCGSGDKLLGGPQAGLLAGKAELVERCRRHPLYRALRLGRGAAAALDALLRLHLAGRALPLDALWPDPAAHRARLERVAARLGAEIVAAEAFVGGGAAPAAPIAGEALALPGDEALARRLREGAPAVVGYLRAGRLLLDLRTVASEDDDALVATALLALAAAAAGDAEPALDGSGTAAGVIATGPGRGTAG
jgi:L-seryl-tRNA(Ser) seleniumtransferase